MKSFFTRVSVGIVLLIINLTAVYYGGYALLALVFLLCQFAVYEMRHLLQKIDMHPPLLATHILAAVILILAFLNKIEMIVAVVLISELLLFISHTFDLISLQDHFAVLFIEIYIVFSFSTMLLLRRSYLIWMIFIISWGTDSFAYVFGMMFGKHKLAPQLSPKKTVEGFVGGIIGAVLLTFLFAYFMPLNMYSSILFSIFGSVFSQIGDLCASKLKRMADLKDYSRLLRSHGGILDRYDSILFVSPLIYFYFLLLGGI